MSKLYYISKDYIPKGKISHLPLIAIDRMIHEQVKQGNYANVKVFEADAKATARFGGFWWHKTGFQDVWVELFTKNNLYPFMARYGDSHINKIEFKEVIGRKTENKEQ